MSDTTLLPCPFCASDNLSTEWGWIACRNCDSAGPFNEELAEATKSWNTRTPDPRLAAAQGLADALEESLEVACHETCDFVSDRFPTHTQECKAARAALTAWEKAVR